MADKYPSLSPYAYCSWNPVKLVDPDGREFVIPPECEKNIDKLLKEALFRLDNCQKEDYQEMAMQIADMKCEIQQLRQSNQIYRIEPSLSHFQGHGDDSSNGLTQYDTKKNEVVITYKPGCYGSLAQELKHAYQFEVGEIAFNNEGSGSPRFGYDIYDEVAGWERTWIFTGEHKTAESLSMRESYKYLSRISLGVNTRLINSEGTPMGLLKEQKSFQKANLYYR